MLVVSALIALGGYIIVYITVIRRRWINTNDPVACSHCHTILRPSSQQVCKEPIIDILMITSAAVISRHGCIRNSGSQKPTTINSTICGKDQEGKQWPLQLNRPFLILPYRLVIVSYILRSTDATSCLTLFQGTLPPWQCVWLYLSPFCLMSTSTPSTYSFHHIDHP